MKGKRSFYHEENEQKLENYFEIIFLNPALDHQ